MQHVKIIFLSIIISPDILLIGSGRKFDFALGFPLHLVLSIYFFDYIRRILKNTEKKANFKIILANWMKNELLIKR